MSAGTLLRFATRVVQVGHAHGARVLVNGDAELAQRAGADGVHLTSAQLRQFDKRPASPLIGASCHDAGELARARELGVDFAVLGPVLPTPTHPGATGMGWDTLADLLTDGHLPVYALGGLNAVDLERAWDCGAHGIGMMRGAWR